MSKELNEEELDNVAGGVENYNNGNYICPICKVLSRPIMKYNNWKSLSRHLSAEHYRNSTCVRIISRADGVFETSNLDDDSAYEALCDGVDGVMDPSALTIDDNGGFKS